MRRLLITAALTGCASLSLPAGPTLQADAAQLTLSGRVPATTVLQTAVKAKTGCAAAPAWKQRKTRFGISLGSNGGSSMGQDLKAEQKRFGTRIPVVRTWDNTLPMRTSWSVKKKWYGKRWVVNTIRIAPRTVLSGKYDKRLRTYFRTAPRKTPVFWNYFHEPEDEIRAGKFTAKQYRKAWRHVARIAASFCRSNLYPTLVLMGWTADSRATPTWTALNPGRRFVSVYAWDPYNGALGDATHYERPAKIFRPVVKASKKMNRPWAIAETGSVRVPSDTSGTGRAAWLRKVAKYSRRHHAVFVTYYQSTRNGDFELRRRPEIPVWRKAMG
ncbi:MAG: hypothetical protein QM638_05080 [Nocardioides sp.]|uniref:hypothetical protein n=1 Tax=Nocardioides sp. TaxID=35761 RepID=UPI0039E4B792